METRHMARMIAAMFLLSVMITPALAAPASQKTPEGKPFQDLWDALTGLQNQVRGLVNRIAALEGSNSDAFTDLREQIQGLVSRITALEEASGDTGAGIGTACTSDKECASGNCIDGVCCDTKCEGHCTYCAFAGKVGTCTAVPDAQDPRKACQVSLGGHPACGGACYSGQCAFPDLGTRCGLCAVCDGTGRCTEMPPDDSECGVISCIGLETHCRVYSDLTANRCAALGSCKADNDPATCTIFTDIPC